MTANSATTPVTDSAALASAVGRPTDANSAAGSRPSALAYASGANTTAAGSR